MKTKTILVIAIFLGLFTLWEITSLLFRQVPPRRYPQFIKAAMTQSLALSPTLPQRQLRKNLLIKERLGINTYLVLSCYQYRDGKFSPCMPKPLMRWLVAKEILAAKEKGLATALLVSWHKGKEPQLDDRIKVEKFLQDYQEILLREAKFAEHYQVEYLSLNEPDHLLSVQSFAYTNKEKALLINRFKEKLLNRLKEVYHGKIYYQIGSAGDWDFSWLDPSGLDFFGVLISGGCDFSEFQKRTDRIFSKAESLSRKYQLPWIISELWINKKYHYPQFCNLEGERETYYRYVLGKAKDSRNLLGIVVDTWNFDDPRSGFEASIKNTPAEGAVKNLFEGF